MDPVIQFLLRHGYAVLFVFVLAEQIGLPLPAVPVLLAVGALAGTGQLSFPVALLVAAAAALLSDFTWYHLGRRRGVKHHRAFALFSLGHICSPFLSS